MEDARVGAARARAFVSGILPMAMADPIRIGILHSASGTMALNETSLRDVILMEVDRANAAGGLLGRRIDAVVLDPASDWLRYRDMAQALVHEHGVAAVFGCWTSISRKSVLPVIEQADNLLFYPMQYEGEENSANVFYLGATPNQQAIPALEFLMSAAGGAHSRFFFVGTDYVYPRTTHRVLRSFLQAKGLPVATFPEHYVPFGHHEWSSEIEALQRFRAKGRGAVISTLNGDSNLSFYRAARQAGLRADETPIMALSVSEAELQWLDPDDIAGHYACWDYFMAQPGAENQAFVAAWHARVGPDRPVYAPMASAVLGFRLWCKAVTAAGTTATPSVRQYMLGQSETTLNGRAVVMGVNHHVEIAVSVGKATRHRQFEVVWHVPRPIAGDPWAAANIIADAAASSAQRDLLDALPTPLIVLDDEGRLRYRSASTYEHFGAEIGAAQLAALRAVVAGLEGAAPQTPPMADGPLPEITLQDTRGRTRHMTVAVQRMLFSGDPAHLFSLSDVSYIRDMEERLRSLNDELQRLATTDPLTGANNRRKFVAAVNAQLRAMQRHRRPAALFILDLDFFKSINDRFGHDVGDQALVQATRIVQAMLREQDVFARIGGEEFAALLRDTDLDSGVVVAERLRRAVAAMRLDAGDGSTGITCSIGITAIDADSDTPDSAMKRADDALYLSKHEGRDRVHRC
jgi:urea transport system substrate-binding protein